MLGVKPNLDNQNEEIVEQTEDKKKKKTKHLKEKNKNKFSLFGKKTKEVTGTSDELVDSILPESEDEEGGQLITFQPDNLVKDNIKENTKSVDVNVSLKELKREATTAKLNCASYYDEPADMQYNAIAKNLEIGKLPQKAIVQLNSLTKEFDIISIMQSTVARIVEQRQLQQRTAEVMTTTSSTDSIVSDSQKSEIKFSII